MKLKFRDKVRVMDSYNGIVVDTRTLHNKNKEACVKVSKKSMAYANGNNMKWIPFDFIKKL